MPKVAPKIFLAFKVTHIAVSKLNICYMSRIYANQDVYIQVWGWTSPDQLTAMEVEAATTLNTSPAKDPELNSGSKKPSDGPKGVKLCGKFLKKFLWKFLTSKAHFLSEIEYRIKIGINTR